MPFKKGNIPHNKKPEFSERKDKDGYVLIKVNGNYIPKRRYVYESNFGKISKENFVIHIDGNNENFEPENLKEVSKKQFMLSQRNDKKAGEGVKRRWSISFNLNQLGIKRAWYRNEHQMSGGNLQIDKYEKRKNPDLIADEIY